MPASSRSTTTVRSLTWTIRIVASIEALDAVMYLADAGWFAANQILTALVAGGIVGAALTWVRRPLAVVGVGGLLVAIAPSSLYPLSALLVVASLGIVAMTRVRVRSGAREQRGGANLA